MAVLNDRNSPENNFNPCCEQPNVLILNHLYICRNCGFLRNLLPQKTLEPLILILKELGYCVTKNHKVEIVTPQGRFSIILMTGKVYFQPICDHCMNAGSQCPIRPIGKSLCMISDGTGWSNINLGYSDLLILAILFAIIENRLPKQVLVKMRRACPRIRIKNKHKTFPSFNP